MPVQPFELGELQIASSSSKQSLYLACSITLDLPLSIDGQIDVEDLAELTGSGQLWIAKADTCRLEVAASVGVIDAQGLDAPSALRQHIIEAIGACPVSVPFLFPFYRKI